jgi:SAM-dependent methyltransferase
LIPTHSHPDLWQKEYDRQGIPSSFREEPSGSVKEFATYLRQAGITSGTGLDLGTGTGRNAIYLARIGFDMFAIDFVPSLIGRLTTLVREENLQRLHPLCRSITEHWPFQDATLDIAIDTFCYKHQITAEARNIYRRELRRSLKQGGYYLLTLAGKDDGYYGPLLDDSLSNTSRMIVDPQNGIASILYSKEEVEQDFKDAFERCFYEHKEHEHVMHGMSYLRSTHVFIFRKKKEQVG